MRHSKYGPSKLKQILLCPGCLQAEEELIAGGAILREQPTSEAAAEGTILHGYMERLARLFGNATLEEVHQVIETEVPAKSQDAIRESFGKLASFWQTIANGSQSVTDTYLFIEQEVSLANANIACAPGINTDEIFGTADILIYNIRTRHLGILDFKFGQFPVYANANPQLLLYALLSICSLPVIINTPPEKITLAISQPARDNYSVWSTDLAYLNTWWNQAVVPKLQQAVEGGIRMPSEDACRFCRAKAYCKARDEKYVHYLKNNPINGIKALTKEESLNRINNLAKLISEARLWADDLETLLMENLQSGDALPDWKLVAGRKGAREWQDQEEAEKFLTRQGLKQEERRTSKLISPAQAEKLLKGRMSTKATTIFGRLTVQKEGKITYASKEDPRTEIIPESKQPKTTTTLKTGLLL